MTSRLEQILACPSCGQPMAFEQAIRCSICKKEASVDGRLLDFSSLTPALPLHFARMTKDLHQYAGRVMEDIPRDWRVQETLDFVRRKGQGEVCLEIGGGDGPITPHLEDLFEVVLTIDFSRPFLKRIEKKTSKTVCLLGDAQFLPIQRQAVDTVICTEVLEHVAVPTQLLAEIQRVMTRDGVCILSVPYEAGVSLRRRHGVTKQLLCKDTHASFYDPVSLEKLLFRMGLQILEIQCISSPTSLRWSLRHPLSSLARFLLGEYILCSLRPMDNPGLYWQVFTEALSEAAAERVELASRGEDKP